MTKKKINSFKEFLDQIEILDLLGYNINLFRGQSGNDPLLPSIARDNRTFNTTKTEVEMLEDFKRRSSLLINKNFINDWEWLVYAQHYGLKTRLLDWTSNPLVALWFACGNEYKLDESSYLYILSADKDMLVDMDANSSPFQIRATKILMPKLNNERIVAQSGWFTAHAYSVPNKTFFPLENNNRTKDLLTQIEIPPEIKREIIDRLSIFGINSRTVFPDIVGLCLHLNWKHLKELPKK